MPGPSSSATSAPSASAFSFSPNFATFPPPDLGFMIRNARPGGGTSRNGMPASGGCRGQRPPGGPGRQHQQRDRHDGDPDQVVQGKHHQHRDQDQDHQAGRHPPQHAPVGQEPVPARRDQARRDRPDGHQGQVGQVRETDQHRRRGQHQPESSPGQPASAHDLPPHRQAIRAQLSPRHHAPGSSTRSEHHPEHHAGRAPGRQRRMRRRQLVVPNAPLPWPFLFGRRRMCQSSVMRNLARPGPGTAR